MNNACPELATSSRFQTIGCPMRSWYPASLPDAIPRLTSRHWNVENHGMAWRLDEAVEHGMIDNTVEGTTTGKIWLVGRDEPLILSLNGDCWRDLAGTILEFENPDPEKDAEAVSLDTEQTGIVGDMTASRKARVPTISDAEMDEYLRDGKEIPTNWQNTLYLEWFSEINGRVLIETVGFSLKISDREWDMDADAEEAQKLANLSSMRDFLAQVIQRIEPGSEKSSGKKNGVRTEMNEFQWEERLKESDRLTDAYQEVLEKYMEDPESERKEAFVMGWDGLLGSMADREEGDDDYDDFEDDDDEGDDEDQSGSEWMHADDDDEDDVDDEDSWEAGEDHPLQTRAQEVAMRAFTLVGRDGKENSPQDRLVSNLMQVTAKLAGVLNDREDEYEPEAGFILAVLKRCLGWINESIGGCGDLIEAEEDSDHVAALKHLRGEIFGIRDGIIELRRELKRS